MDSNFLLLLALEHISTAAVTESTFSSRLRLCSASSNCFNFLTTLRPIGDRTSRFRMSFSSLFYAFTVVNVEDAGQRVRCWTKSKLRPP
jgi:hypothetical protein